MNANTGNQQEGHTEQQEKKDSSKDLKAEEPTTQEVIPVAEKTVLQGTMQNNFNVLQKEREELLRLVEELKEYLREEREALAKTEENAELVAEELDWLWNQVKEFAGQGKPNSTVLMTIQPENSKPVWEVWGQLGTNSTPTLTRQRTYLLMSTRPFQITGYTHCKFTMNWYFCEAQMISVIDNPSRSPYSRAIITGTSNMHNMTRQKERLKSKMEECTGCGAIVPETTPGCDACEFRINKDDDDNDNNDDDNDNNDDDKDKDNKDKNKDNDKNKDSNKNKDKDDKDKDKDNNDKDNKDKDKDKDNKKKDKEKNNKDKEKDKDTDSDKDNNDDNNNIVISDGSDIEDDVKSGQAQSGTSMGASGSTGSSYAGREAQQNTGRERQTVADLITLLENQESEWQEDEVPRERPFMAPMRVGKQDALEEKGEVVEDTTEREDRSRSPEFSPKSDGESDGEGESTKVTSAATAGGEGTRLPVAAKISQEATATAPATTSATAPATAPTTKVQDAFTKALSEKKGNTLLLTMWESGKPCEPMAKNERGQEVDFDLVEMRTGEVQIATTTGGSETRRMVLTAWTGTDITRAERKNKAEANNYIVVILKKEEVQTWGDVEIHLWREYRRHWNTNK